MQISVNNLIDLYAYKLRQGGRSCTKARRAFAEKFGLGRKFQALIYAIWRDIMICRDLHVF